MLSTLLHAVAAFVVAHQSAIIGALVATVVPALISQIPPRWGRVPVLGYVVRVLDRANVLAHQLDPRTLKLPGLQSLVYRAALDVLAGRDRNDEIPPPPPGASQR